MKSEQLHLALVALFFGIHILVSLLRDALRFASLGYLIDHLKQRFDDDEMILLHQTRMEKYFDNRGRNLRELEWISFVTLLFLWASVVLYFSGDSETLKPMDVMKMLIYSGAVVLGINLFILRALSEPFAEMFLFHFYPLWRAMHLLMSPFSSLLNAVQIGIMRIAGTKRDDTDSEQNVLDSMAKGEKAGVFEDSEREMIENIIEFKNLDAGEVMTPRTEIVAVSIDSTIDNIITRMLEDGYSRIPVFKESKDHIVGYVHVRGILPYWRKNSPPATVEELLHPIAFVPESKKIKDLLQEFKKQHQHIAVVLDEYGGTSGLITIEDILEEIVGDIVDEHQQKEEELVMKVDGRKAEVSARLRISELNEGFGLHLEEDEGYDSVGGWLISQLGRIPSEGEKGAIDGMDLRYHVLKADPRRIESLLLEKVDDRDEN